MGKDVNYLMLTTSTFILVNAKNALHSIVDNESFLLPSHKIDPVGFCMAWPLSAGKFKQC